MRERPKRGLGTQPVYAWLHRYKIFLMNRRRALTLKKIIAGSKDIRFSEMVNLVEGFGFALSRTDGSHHIFARPDIQELVNLQNVKGQAKPYQGAPISETCRET